MHNSSTTADHLDPPHENLHPRQGRGCGGMRKRRWSALEIAVIVGSFIVFWPLGVAAIFVKLAKGELWRGAADSVPPWQAWSGKANDVANDMGFGKWAAKWQGPSSGNAAFDEYRKSQLDRLEDERRKLEDEQRAFAVHLAKLRRAKDQDEFDRFMAERNTQSKDGPADAPSA